jgi:hypothetical protein
MRSFISIASAESASQAVWEEAGQDLWDVTALEHPATVLYDAGAVEMLSAVGRPPPPVAPGALQSWRWGFWATLRATHLFAPSFF